MIYIAGSSPFRRILRDIARKQKDISPNGMQNLKK